MTTFKISTSQDERSQWFNNVINKEFFLQCLIQEGLMIATPGEWMECVQLDGGRIDAEELLFWDPDCSIISWRESVVETDKGVKQLKDVQVVTFEKRVLLNMIEKFQGVSPAGHFVCILKEICDYLNLSAESTEGIAVIEFKD